MTSWDDFIFTYAVGCRVLDDVCVLGSSHNKVVLTSKFVICSRVNVIVESLIVFTSRSELVPDVQFSKLNTWAYLSLLSRNLSSSGGALIFWCGIWCSPVLKTTSRSLPTGFLMALRSDIPRRKSDGAFGQTSSLAMAKPDLKGSKAPNCGTSTMKLSSHPFLSLTFYLWYGPTIDNLETNCRVHCFRDIHYALIFLPSFYSYQSWKHFLVKRGPCCKWGTHLQLQAQALLLPGKYTHFNWSAPSHKLNPIENLHHWYHEYIDII